MKDEQIQPARQIELSQAMLEDERIPDHWRERTQNRINERALDNWFRMLPERMAHAYHNDSTVNQIVRQHAYAGDTKERMLEHLCEVLFEQRNKLIQDKLEDARNAPFPPYFIPRG